MIVVCGGVGTGGVTCCRGSVVAVDGILSLLGSNTDKVTFQFTFSLKSDAFGRKKLMQLCR